MLWPAWMAAWASASTAGGTGVSQTPWARLMPPIASQARVMARISDWTAAGARWLRARPFGKLRAGCGAVAFVLGMGSSNILVLSSYLLGALGRYGFAGDSLRG